MGDSPSLTFTPPSDGDYIQSVFDDMVSYSGCDEDDSAAVLKCLRSVDTETLARAGKKVLAARPATRYVFAPQLDGEFITTRPVEGFTEGKFAQVPVLFGANSDEGANWSSELKDPNANTSMPNATEDTVYNFLQGQYASLTKKSFNNALALYPLEDYGNSFSLQGQQMYGELRYICTASLITGGAASKSPMKAFQYHYNNDHLGSDHRAELVAFWGDASAASDDDEALFKGMREFYSSFVTSGQPQSSLATWEATDPRGTRRLRLDPAGTRMEEMSTQAKRCEFWHSLGQEINI
ncbi:hypothetical protein AAF712_006532 [Marasmius tenuissimus]|uniref:Carboxylesterase type B domain-containing protein n=1 Tax=Marasmius tenuissimus TaxID=585030 RepID=A0ABR3A0D7_9AGAR